MQSHSADSNHSNPEELLDVFKAAALSVTKLFKTSTAAQSKARVDGYQDCLEDLLAVIDKGDADVRSIRRWILERLDGRESVLSTVESEDEVDKTDSTPEPRSVRHAAAAGNTGTSRASVSTVPAGVDTPMATATESEMDTETETSSPVKSLATKRTARAGPSAASTPAAAPAPTLSSTASAAAMSALAAKKAAAKNAKARAIASPPAPVPATPSDSTGAPEMAEGPDAGAGDFSFRSAVPYPTDSFLEIANLDLSDRRSAPGAAKEQPDAAMFTPPSSSSFASAPTNTNTQAPASTTFIFNAPASSNAEGVPVPTSARQFRVRHGGARTNGRSILTARYNRSSAGQKRKLNFDEIFDVASLGYGKDVFSRSGPKRSRQT